MKDNSKTTAVTSTNSSARVNRGNSDDDRVLVPFIRDVLAVANVSDQPPVVQIAVGASGGVVTGYLFGKTSKFVAAFVGGAILLVQLFECQGYLTINKKRLSRDIGQAKEQLSAVLGTVNNGETKNWVDNCVAKGEALISRKSTKNNGVVSNFLIQNIRTIGGFLGGALLGFGLS
uniref:FUN14 domain-containing protein 1 n=1 Tax=Meloidogyne incognita TaxID=6306 RepID=A0A914L8Q7_MELIC